MKARGGNLVGEAGQLGELGHMTMEDVVRGVKAFVIRRGDDLDLILEVGTELGDDCGTRTARKVVDDLRLDSASDERAFHNVGRRNARDVGADLGDHGDKTHSREPVDGVGHRLARDPELGGDLVLVERLAGLALDPHDLGHQDLEHRLRAAAARSGADVLLIRNVRSSSLRARTGT